MPNTGHQTNDFIPYDSSMNYDQDQDMSDPSPTASQTSDDSSADSSSADSSSAPQDDDHHTPTATPVPAYYQRFNDLPTALGSPQAFSNGSVPEIHIIIVSIEAQPGSSERRLVPRAFLNRRFALQHAIALFNAVFRPIPGSVLRTEQPSLEKWTVILEDGNEGIVRLITLPLVDVRPSTV